MSINEQVLAQRLEALIEERRRLADNITFQCEGAQWKLCVIDEKRPVGWPERTTLFPIPETRTAQES